MRIPQLIDAPPSVAGDWSAITVYFAGTSWDGNRGTDQHMAARLSGSRSVLFVDPPVPVLRTGTAGRLAVRPRLQQLDERLLRLTPVAPPAQTRRGMRGLSAAVLRRTTTAALVHLSSRADVVVAAGLWPALESVPARLKVLYGTDDFVAGAELMGMSRAWVERCEARQLHAADRIVAVSEELAVRWRSRGRDVVVIENGCDVDPLRDVGLAVRAEDVQLPGPVVGFIGHLSDRIDLALLEAVADDGHSLLLVGPMARGFETQRLAHLLVRENVQWVGPKPYDQLPRYLRTMSVGIVPYADSAFNRASSPLKTLEYLASGLPAVVTDLPAMRRLPDMAVRRASSPRAFADEVARVLTAAPDADAAARRRAVAALFSWDSRALRFGELLDAREADAPEFSRLQQG